RRGQHGLRRHGAGGGHRPDQSGAGGAAERGGDRLALADGRGADHRYPGGQAGGRSRGAARRYVLISSPRRGASPPRRTSEGASTAPSDASPKIDCAGEAGARTRWSSTVRRRSTWGLRRVVAISFEG